MKSNYSYDGATIDLGVLGAFPSIVRASVDWCRVSSLGCVTIDEVFVIIDGNSLDVLSYMDPSAIDDLEGVILADYVVKSFENKAG